MSETITLQLSPQVISNARYFAKQTHRRVEDVLVEWINRGATEIPIENLSDEQILALCNLQIDPVQQEQFSQLLAKHREGTLKTAEKETFDELMRVYWYGLVQKAQALKVAVERGLRPFLS